MLELPFGGRCQGPVLTQGQVWTNGRIGSAPVQLTRGYDPTASRQSCMLMHRRVWANARFCRRAGALSMVQVASGQPAHLRGW